MKPINFLFPTVPDDSHAFLVKTCLESLGHQVRILYTSDAPTRQCNSIYIEDQHYSWCSTDAFASISENDYDVVWWRRPRKPFVPKEITHPEDYPFTQRENVLFFESLAYNLAPDAWWVNPKQAAERTNAKLLQLKIASQCGMTVPPTLCSNNPEDIKTFLKNNNPYSTIYKSLSPCFWNHPKGIKMIYTSRVTDGNLPEDDTLKLTPGIFQQEIKKQFELRITCFGDYLLAVKLYSQEHEDGILDWRTVQYGALKVEPYILPVKLEHQIRQFMQKIGIVFGAFDFIVTEEGDYIFLEVNEQGQFLWIEDYNPEICMLNIFVHFLLHGSHLFHWKEKEPIFRINDHDHYVQQTIKNNLLYHVNTNQLNSNPL